MKEIKYLKFSTTWCPPCKALQMIINENYSDRNIESIDADVKMDLVRQYNVRSLPTIIKLEDGIETGRIVGPNRDAIDTLFNANS